MSRPLIQKRIDELEAMFDAEKGDPDALRLLENELAFRSVPRATTLLNKVKRVLAGGTVAEAKQDELFAHRPPVAVQVPLMPIKPTSSPKPVISMTIDEALKVLKVTASTGWEAVEQSRRDAVERARPDRLTSLSETKRRTLREDARSANAAYLVMLQARKA
ncbi:hypothetical protein ACPOL_4550 [Acidisarcina polymorpha]|uniref:Uncharacterized protein n=1 Tax=Acidisarcina polymorpha TaxID=2211140 RepID=A0A2Z5G3V8_9BACT|nr:hypothetical protein [Acidisarcina polymorpha]AXC13822.1 hypothetical protein ACPOL_4550 [Acidisarcina polymorpha]